MPKIQLIILDMERTLDSTLLHTLRLRLLQDYPGQIAACVDVLADADLWWRPHENANAIGNLLIHLAQSNRYYCEEVLGGRVIDRDRDAEFTRRGGMTKAEVQGLWSGALAVMREVLTGLEPGRLNEVTERTGKATTIAQILLHVSHHNALHVGQVLWVTKMLKPGALDDVGRRLRSR